MAEQRYPPMPLVTADRMVAAGVAVPAVASVVAPHLDAACRRFELNTARRIAALLGQCAIESKGFSARLENLHYTAAGLMRVWPKKFPSLAKAQEYANQPEKIANYCYAGIIGNGPEASGDGWAFRGRGFLQVTGRWNYKAMGDVLGANLVGTPDLVAEPEYAALTAAAFFSVNGLLPLADAGEIDAITLKINKAGLGINERRALYQKALPVFEEVA